MTNTTIATRTAQAITQTPMAPPVLSLVRRLPDRECRRSAEILQMTG